MKILATVKRLREATAAPDTGSKVLVYRSDLQALLKDYDQVSRSMRSLYQLAGELQLDAELERRNSPVREVLLKVSRRITNTINNNSQRTRLNQ